MNGWKKLFAVALSAVMLFSVIPTDIFADEGPEFLETVRDSGLVTVDNPAAVPETVVIQRG